MILSPASPLATLPSFQVLLTTEAGRPLYHYVHPNSPNHSQTSTLSAAFAAFSATTAGTVSAIRTPSFTLLTISKSPILLGIASQTLQHSIHYLRALARQTLAAVYTCLSASFIQHLTNFPTYDTTSIAARFEPLLNRIITSALTYPLPLALSLLPSLPAPIDPSSHTFFSNTVGKALTNFKHVSHILIFTASPPYLRRIIASVSRENARLLTPDLLMLLQVPPLHVNDKSITPELLFLPTCGFRKGCRVALRALSLELDSGNPGTNPSSICGINLQSLRSANSHALWLMVLGEWREGENREQQVLNYLESALDRSNVAKDVMVGLRRPWKVPDMIGMERCSRHVKAVIMLGNERFVETLDAFDYRLATAVLSILELSCGSYISLVLNDMLVVMCERRYIVVFDDNISEEDARYAMKQAFVPWMKRFRTSLIPIDKATIVQPSTPLAGFLAPFSS